MCTHYWVYIKKEINGITQYRTICKKCEKLKLCKKCGSDNIKGETFWGYDSQLDNFDCKNCESIQNQKDELFYNNQMRRYFPNA